MGGWISVRRGCLLAGDVGRRDGGPCLWQSVIDDAAMRDAAMPLKPIPEVPVPREKIYDL